MQTPSRITVSRSQYALPLLIITLLALFASIALITSTWMPIQGNVVPQLVGLMTTIGVLLTIVAYVLYKSEVLQYLVSLRLLMVLTVGIIVAVVLLYLWILSEVFFANTIYLSFMTMGMFFAGVSSISFGYFVSRAMTRRLFALADAAGQVARGDFSTRLDVRGNDEIAFLARSFNSMAADLQEIDTQKRQLEQTRRDLVAWVSHDLRTPLTSMRLMLEALADGVITDSETQHRYVNTTLKEIQHLSDMLTDLFEMAKLDVGHIELDLQWMPIGDLISDTIGGMMAKAQQKGVTLEGYVDDGVDLVYVAPDKIQRVLKNLIDNAIKYTPAGEHVMISARRGDDISVRIDVHNSGVHIPPEILPNLFDSFYRGEQSRANTSDERGTGLGLAIARGFVQAHGGEITVASNPDEGTVFSFTIPHRQPDNRE